MDEGNVASEGQNDSQENLRDAAVAAGSEELGGVKKEVAQEKTKKEAEELKGQLDGDKPKKRRRRRRRKKKVEGGEVENQIDETNKSDNTEAVIGENPIGKEDVSASGVTNNEAAVPVNPFAPASEAPEASEAVSSMPSESAAHEEAAIPEAPAAPVNPFISQPTSAAAPESQPVELSPEPEPEPAPAAPVNPFAPAPTPAAEPVSEPPVQHQPTSQPESQPNLNPEPAPVPAAPVNPFAPRPEPPPAAEAPAEPAPTPQASPFEQDQQTQHDFAAEDHVSKQEDQQEAKQEADKDSEAVNPFLPKEGAKQEGSSLDSAMEDKPLDEVQDVEVLNKEAKSAEDIGHSVESTDAAESSTAESVTAEVVDVSESSESSENSAEERASELPEGEFTYETEARNTDLDGFSSEFWEIMEQAGLTKKSFFIGLGLFLTVVLALILFFTGSLNFIFGSDDDGGEVSAPVEKAPIMREAPEPGEGAVVSDNDAVEVDSSYIFGSEYGDDLRPVGSFGNNDGVLSVLEYGVDLVALQNEFEYQMELLRRMQNIYDTDVYALLDQSLSRRETLETHITEMDALVTEGLGIYDVLGRKMDQLDAQFASLSQERNSYEEEYFTFSQSLNGSQAYANLQAFINSAQLGVELKAMYNAYQTMREMFANSLNALRPRLEDVQANTEALIEGVRVFDVNDSDINAIIRLD